jgi:hypothetical protein
MSEPKPQTTGSADVVIAEFMVAWHRANPTHHGVPEVTYENGYFVFRYDGNFSDRVRRSDLLRMTERLIERVQKDEVAE